MFGLESDKGKKKAEGFVFDLEKELADKKKQKEILDKITGRVQQIRGLLRAGEDQALFQKLGALLYGYGALIKVMSRIKVK
jgi:hypothetical protein